MESLIREQLKHMKIDENNLYKIAELKVQLRQNKEYNVHEFIKHCNATKDLVLTHSLKDIINQYSNKYSFMNDPMYIEIRHTLMYLKYIIYNTLYSDISLLQKDESFLERVYIRIILLSKGWTSSSIEKFINRYYPEVKLGENKIYLSYYVFIEEIIYSCKNSKIKLIKGRPIVPIVIKNIVKKYRNEKVKNDMTVKYTLVKEIKGLFTQNELENLKDIVKENLNESDQNQIVKKLDILKKYIIN